MGKKKEKKVAGAVGVTPNETPVQEAPKNTKEAVDVVKNDVEYIRTYSPEVHGENFLDLANEFIGKPSHPNCKLVPSSSVKSVVVEHRVEQKNDAGVTTGFVTKSERFEDKDAAIAYKNEVRGVCKISKK